MARGQAGAVLGLCAWPWVLQTETCLFCSCLLQAVPAVAFQVIFLFFYAGLVVAGLAHILVAKFLTKGSGREGGRKGKDIAWPKPWKVAWWSPAWGSHSSCGPANLLLILVPRKMGTCLANSGWAVGLAREPVMP